MVDDITQDEASASSRPGKTELEDPLKKLRRPIKHHQGSAALAAVRRRVEEHHESPDTGLREDARIKKRMLEETHPHTHKTVMTRKGPVYLEVDEHGEIVRMTRELPEDYKPRPDEEVLHSKENWLAEAVKKMKVEPITPWKKAKKVGV